MTGPGALGSKKTLHGLFMPTVHESSFEASVLIYGMLRKETLFATAEKSFDNKTLEY
jgi:hypothetical protein